MKHAILLVLFLAATSFAGIGPSSGGSGTPGGASGEVQYNDAGAFGGIEAGDDGDYLTLSGGLPVWAPAVPGGVAWGDITGTLSDQTDLQTALDAKVNTSDAVSTNTADKVCKRDGSGNFAAGTITAALSGNATTATALAANPTDCGVGEFANAIAANGNLTCATPSSSGDVTGPASSTNFAIAKFDGTGGKTLKNSLVTIADTTGLMTFLGTSGQNLICSTDGCGNIGTSNSAGRFTQMFLKGGDNYGITIGSAADSGSGAASGFSVYGAGGTGGVFMYMRPAGSAQWFEFGNNGGAYIVRSQSGGGLTVHQIGQDGKHTIGAGTSVVHRFNGATVATAANTATLTNSPISGNPAAYAKINWNGTDYIMPLWTAP